MAFKPITILRFVYKPQLPQGLKNNKPDMAVEKVLKHIFTTDIGEIRIISRDEKKQDWMRHTLQAQYPEHCSKGQFYVGDVRNLDSVRDVIYGANYVFHAAALKEVLVSFYQWKRR